MRILLIFASILALKNPSKRWFPSTFFRHFPQDTSKIPPRRPKTPPRHLQDGFKTLQEASKTALRPPKTPPRRLWTAQRRLQAASSCLETPQECHKIETFEKSLNFHRFSFDFSSFFVFFGRPMERKRADPSE